MRIGPPSVPAVRIQMWHHLKSGLYGCSSPLAFTSPCESSCNLLFTEMLLFHPKNPPFLVMSKSKNPNIPAGSINRENVKIFANHLGKFRFNKSSRDSTAVLKVYSPLPNSMRSDDFSCSILSNSSAVRLCMRLSVNTMIGVCVCFARSITDCCTSRKAA